MWLIPLSHLTVPYLVVFYRTDPLITFDYFQFAQSPYYLQLFSIWPIPLLPSTVFIIWLIPLLPSTVFYLTDHLIIVDYFLYSWSPHYLWLFSIWPIPLLPLTVFYMTHPLITFDCSFLLVPRPPVEQWRGPTRLDHRPDRWDGSVAASCLCSPCETREPTKQCNNADLSSCSGNIQSLWKWNIE